MASRKTWSENKLEESVLTALFEASQGKAGGLSGDAICMKFNLDEEQAFNLLVPAVNKLENEGLVAMEAPGFRITEKGIDFLIQSKASLDFSPPDDSLNAKMVK